MKVLNLSVNRVIIVIGILIIGLIFISDLGYGGEPKKIALVFRYDDYSSLSPKDFEKKLINTFKKFNIPLTVGIIPYIVRRDFFDSSPQKVIPLSQEDIQILRTAIDEGIIEPALHGYSHQRGKVKLSEFSEVSYEKQFMRIKKGKELLENNLGEKITIFIPPWNNYDGNTLKCLDVLDFNCISADLAGTSGRNSRLNFLPATTDIFQLRQAIYSARRSSCSFQVIVVFFHADEFVEVDSNGGVLTYEHFWNMLSWIASQKDIQISTMNEIIKKKEFETSLYLKNKMYFKIQELIPPILRHPLNLDRGVLFCSQHISKNLFKMWTVTIGFGLIILLVATFCSFRMGVIIFSRYNIFKVLAQWSMPFLFIFALVFILNDFSISYLGLAILLIVSGIFCGVYISINTLNKKSKTSKE